MRSGNRDMRRMLDKMGLEMKDLGNVEEVIIRTENKEFYLSKPQVIEMKGKDRYNFSDSCNEYRRISEGNAINQRRRYHTSNATGLSN